MHFGKYAATPNSFTTVAQMTLTFLCKQKKILHLLVSGGWKTGVWWGKSQAARGRGGVICRAAILTSRAAPRGRVGAWRRRGASYSVLVLLGAAHGPPVSPTPHKWRAGTVQDRSLSVQILTRPVRHGSAITAACLVSFQVLNFSLGYIKENFNI